MLGITINHAADDPLWRQIYAALKEHMLSGALPGGEALPSTRALAQELGVSRNTVCEAYDQLAAEGFAISRQGAPTRVAEGLSIAPANSAAQERRSDGNAPVLVSFRTGQPDLNLFTRFLWQQMLHKAALDLPTEALGYTQSQGLPQLRAEIAAWLLRSRGLKVDADDIFITAGATHGLHVLTDVLCGQNGTMLMEDPCHTGMLDTCVYRGCRVVPAAVDAKGLQTDALQADTHAGAIYVTPSHQFPLGGILPAARRAALIRFARANECYVIEDDYDSEFRYGGEPVAPLYALDPQRVVYVGTFSKTVFPALRIGYVILPQALRQRWNELRLHTDVQNPTLEQAALAEFLQTRKYDRHIQKMRKVYGQRRQALLDALTAHFGEGYAVYGDNAGLHAAVDFAGERFDEDFHAFSLRLGLYITPVESHCMQKGKHLSKLLIGYGHLEPEEIWRGVSLLSACMDAYHARADSPTRKNGPPES